MTEEPAALAQRLARELQAVPAPSGAVLDLRFLAPIIAAAVVARGWRPTSPEPEPPPAEPEHGPQEPGGWRCPPTVDDQSEQGRGQR